MGDLLKIKNQTGPEDALRPEPIADEDDMFEMGKDRILKLGKDAGGLNLIVLIPKSEARASATDISIKRVLASRVPEPEALSALVNEFTKKNSHRLKKLRLRVEIFCLASGRSLSSQTSPPISDSASRTHGAIDLYDVTPRRSCAFGGRKVVMIAEFGLASDAVPVFQLYSPQGERLIKDERMIAQPDRDKTVTRKGTIIFITPPQPQAETMFEKGWEIKLCVMRRSDSMVGAVKFTFEYVPHLFYQPCLFCTFNPDVMGPEKVALRPQKGATRPGLKRRIGPKMEEATPKETGDTPAERESLSSGSPSAIPTPPGSVKKEPGEYNINAYVEVEDAIKEEVDYPSSSIVPYIEMDQYVDMSMPTL